MTSRLLLVPQMGHQAVTPAASSPQGLRCTSNAARALQQSRKRALEGARAARRTRSVLYADEHHVQCDLRADSQDLDLISDADVAVRALIVRPDESCDQRQACSAVLVSVLWAACGGKDDDRATSGA